MKKTEQRLPTEQMLMELQQEDSRYNWRPVPEYEQGLGTPHHREIPTWAGPLQKQFGFYRRGPTRQR